MVMPSKYASWTLTTRPRSASLQIPHLSRPRRGREQIRACRAIRSEPDDGARTEAASKTAKRAHLSSTLAAAVFSTLKTLPRARILAVRIDGMDETRNSQLSSKLKEEETLSRGERVLLRCRLAKELEDTGDYESARELLSPFWRHVGERPDVAELDAETAAELLLRCGTLTGWLGNLKQVKARRKMRRISSGKVSRVSNNRDAS